MTYQYMKLDVLQKLGLSDKSAQVYVAALSLGNATIQDIAAKAGLKRPTVYLHINDLLEQGLVEKHPSGKKEFYRAVDPRFFEKRAEEQLKAVKNMVPELTMMQNTIAGKPQVTVLEGRRALDRVYEEICQANSIRFWSALDIFEDYFSKTFFKISEAIAKNEITTRELIPDTESARKSSRRYATVAGKTYASRCATRGQIYNDSAIYGDTVALFRLHANNLFVILIKEPTIAITMKTLFDMAWESAEPFVGR